MAYEVGGSGGGDAPLSLVLSAATPVAHVLRASTLRVSVDEVTLTRNPAVNPT